MRFNPSRQSYGSTHSLVQVGAPSYEKTYVGHNCGGMSQPPCVPREGATKAEIEEYEKLLASQWRLTTQPHRGEVLPQREAMPTQIILSPSEIFIRGFFGGLITLPEEYAKPAKYVILGLAAYGASGLVRRML